MTAALREQMGAAAVEAARSIDYRGAGTVEFLLDESGTFYFLEMNTRLQVEHPVTEMITGRDLVGLQIQVAQGEPLGFSQADVSLDGHAIEVRLYAEDPANDFLPSTGTVDLWSPPCGDGVRVDAGIETGLEVSPFYDPMLAKVVAWGETRDVARRRLIEALEQTALFGVSSNRDFLIAALGKDVFASGGATTAFIAEEFSDSELGDTVPAFEQVAAAAVLQYVAEREVARECAVAVSDALDNWSSAGDLVSRYQYVVAETEFDLTVSPRGRNDYVVVREEDELAVCLLDCADNVANVVVGEHRRRILFDIPEAGRIHLAMDGRVASLRNAIAVGAEADEQAGGGDVVAPMHGMLLEVVVVAGQMVSKGDRLAVLEAMKMQHEILAQIDGKVSEVLRNAGEQVGADELILQIEEVET